MSESSSSIILGCCENGKLDNHLLLAKSLHLWGCGVSFWTEEIVLWTCSTTLLMVSKLY